MGWYIKDINPFLIQGIMWYLIGALAIVGGAVFMFFLALWLMITGFIGLANATGGIISALFRIFR